MSVQTFRVSGTISFDVEGNYLWHSPPPGITLLNFIFRADHLEHLAALQSDVPGASVRRIVSGTHAANPGSLPNRNVHT